MSRYDLTPDDLFVLREGSPLDRWNTKRQPMAYMRGWAAHGNNVMRVRKDDRPRGWMLHDVSEHASYHAPGEIPLVPECSGPDLIPDWAIATIVREMLSASEPTSTRAQVIMDAARNYAARNYAEQVRA